MMARSSSPGSSLLFMVGIMLVLPAFMSSGGPASGVATALDPASLRTSLGSALSRVQGEASQRIEEGRERLRKCQLAVKVRGLTHVDGFQP
jgi:hypothetical protein